MAQYTRLYDKLCGKYWQAQTIEDAFNVLRECLGEDYIDAVAAHDIEYADKLHKLNQKYKKWEEERDRK